MRMCASEKYDQAAQSVAADGYAMLMDPGFPGFECDPGCNCLEESDRQAEAYELALVVGCD